MLLRDDYPSTDEPQGVHLDIPYPDVEGELSRSLPLVKWILAIPHYIALAVVGSLAVAVTVIAWIAILIAGRYPRELFLFVEGTLRWCLRVGAYAFLLTTDRYPAVPVRRRFLRPYKWSVFTMQFPSACLLP